MPFIAEYWPSVRRRPRSTWARATVASTAAKDTAAALRRAACSATEAAMACSRAMVTAVA